MNRFLPSIPGFALAALAAAPAPAAPAPAYGGLPIGYGYVELADMTLASRMVLAADVRQATPLKREVAVGVPAGRIRYFVEADVRALIGGRGPAPAAVRYLVDLPDSLRKPKLKGVAVLLLAVPGARPGEIILVGPRAQVPRTAENEARVRAILTASLERDAPPAITGIGRAFHVAGSLPGEGETQIFLRTSDNRPISLSILRRPGETPGWAVALSELVDASAAPPTPGSFLWYRLACGLPNALPEGALEGSATADVEQARADYRFVLDALGGCKRE